MTIPASQLVNVIPNVLAAGGSALDLVGLVLTPSTRVPLGTVASFPSTPAVSAYFGASSNEALNIAPTYFSGFTGATKQPGAILFAQAAMGGAAAYLRGGNAAAALTLAQLQGLSGSLTATFDGLARTGSAINLSGATSFSSAATLIQTGLNGALPTLASVTASIAAGTFSVTGSIAGNVMTVTNVASGTVVNGAAITGTGVAAGTVVTGQLSGTAGGIGTYGVNNAQGVASEALSGTYGTLTVSAVGSGTLAVGQTVLGGATLASTIITALGTGVGLTGTYIVNLTQTVGSGALTTQPTPVAVTFDSVSGAFVVASGIAGPASTSGYFTGTLAAPLLLTLATGAVLSQGAAPATAAALMNAIAAVTTNWASFMTAFNPDSAAGTANRIAFAAWTSAQSNRYVYVVFDTDVTPTAGVPAVTSLGYLVQQAAYSGVSVNWEPSDLNLAAFVCGAIASVDFSATNGRTDFAFLSQGGLVAGVTDPTIAVNLAGNPQVAGSFGNGYNFYGAYATAAQNFVTYQRGSVSGPFQWLDSYVNQIWMNNSFQLALMVFLTNSKSVPYNAAGKAAIEAALSGPINAALNFGAIRTGVALSASQAQQVNASAGSNIAPILATRGWYLLIGNTTPSNRQARVSPPMSFYYMDGGSVQAITLNSVELQ